MAVVRKNARRTRTRKGNHNLVFKLVSAMVGLFLVMFLYLYQSQKAREMLMLEQKLWEEEKRLTEENRQLELDIANFCSLDNLQKSIPDSNFGFPPPSNVVHLHWALETEKPKPDWSKKMKDLAFDWFKDALDIRPTTNADSLK